MNEEAGRFDVSSRSQVIADTLRSEIESSLYSIGDRLPSERELGRRFHENRYIIRQSLEQLVHMGFVRPHQGKGHFVCEHPLNLQYRLNPVLGFSAVIEQLGLKPSAQLIKQEKELADSRTQELLNLKPNEEVIRLEILRFADRTPLTLNVTRLPAQYFPNFFEYTSSFYSLYRLLEEKYLVKPVRKHSTFQAVYATIAEAEHLQIQPNSNLLHIESVMQDESKRTMLYTSAKYRGDMAQVSIQFN